MVFNGRIVLFTIYDKSCNHARTNGTNVPESGREQIKLKKKTDAARFTT
jgi:hypothetical protein